MPSNARTGGQILVDQLVAQGVEHVFCVPGESYLAALDALHDAKIAVTVCRQEAGAGFMADASARLSGRPGILFVTRGPGATNAVTGLTDALMDSIPLVVLTGQVPTFMIGTDGFQEADTVGITRPCTKHNWLVKDTDRLAATIHRALPRWR